MTERMIAALTQGKDESIVYSFSTVIWGSNASGILVKAYDVSDGGMSDVSSTVLSGSATVVNNVIILPAVQALIANHQYRIEVKFTADGNTFEPYILIMGEQ
ncbi:MAG: hypothetical protein CVU46_10485 [Chloroflexi bacterium HGW-Chloroflexi-8]|nr:MAG: hypothetical protein CVU46_10485 [Chloroflexi bacterium HGW-Chloroflexi-8]